MSELQSGSQVLHATLGLGKIVAAESDALHVFFPASDSRYAAKLRLPDARRFLRADGFEPDGWLGGLSAFAFDAGAGRWGLTASWLSPAQAIEQYLARSPKGFHAGEAGEARPGAPDRAARWAAAHRAWVDHLGGGAGERLLAAGDAATVVKRLLALDKLVAPLLSPADHGAVAEALDDADRATPYLEALFPLDSVTVPGRARFEAVFRAIRGLPGDPGHHWLVATLFPFLARPDRHVLLRPRVSEHAAARLGSGLGAGEALAWPPYAALRELSVRLLEALAPHGAKDFADVECFLHVTGTAKPPAKKPGVPTRKAAAGAAARSRS